MNRLRARHICVAVLIAVLIPVCVYVVSGEAGAEIMVLGAVLGFAYWYWWIPTV